MIKATYAQNAHLMHLLRLLVFYASFYYFWFTASHIPGIININADALSRNNMAVFFLQAPCSDKDPIQIPTHLVQLVVSRSNMDICSLDDALQGYYSAALATSTHKTCRAAEQKYVAFCEKIEVKHLP